MVSMLTGARVHQATHHRHDATQLLGLVDAAARPGGGLAADVEQVGPVVHQVQAVADAGPREGAGEDEPMTPAAGWRDGAAMAPPWASAGRGLEHREGDGGTVLFNPPLLNASAAPSRGFRPAGEQSDNQHQSHGV